jgi:hypothetical protein
MRHNGLGGIIIITQLLVLVLVPVRTGSDEGLRSQTKTHIFTGTSDVKLDFSVLITHHTNSVLL